MTCKAVMDDFIAQKTLAILGVSRSGKNFGNMVFKELSGKGYTLHPIHPEADSLEGVKAYQDLASLPEKVGGAILVIPPAETEKAVHQAATAGISRVWMQPGAESPEAIRYCQDHQISVIHGECIMMYTSDGGIHKFHRWVWKLLGKEPK